ncbi:MAG: leucine--tRNA ligase [Candidatus Parcubacteria bacterium]|nr:leucine--tRNA ligase [Candidatus Parcubacteria bacterium]
MIEAMKKPTPARAAKEAYDPAKIEKKWQKKWASSKVYRSTESKDAKDKFYVLDMFPYPSGEGLHVGHPKGYIATDVVSRMKRMQGMNVLHPMGFDAFGLPAENYAIKTKTNPADSVAKNVAHYKEQLELLGFDYDWSREVNTTDPKFYKWTQWIFLQMFKKGLAFESFEPVNWCPTDKTVLANEDVEDGRCERCGTLVEKKPMRQWVLKITDYADRLLKDLDATGGIPVVTAREGKGAAHENEPFIERDAAVCIIRHWSEDKYLCVNWKATNWQGFVIGGIEKGEDMGTAGVREIQEETGFKNVRFVREVGKVDTRFYQVIKQVNRHAHYVCGYFELKDGERTDISQEEKDLQDPMWLSPAEVQKFLNHEDMKYLWDLYTGAKKQEIKPLLEWPESIKEAQRNWIGRSEGAEIDFELALTKKKSRYVLIHGYKGSPADDFFPWLKTEFEKKGHEVQAPALPNPNDPKESEQVDFILKNCTLDKNTVIIAHSLGCVSALKALMKSNKQISGLVLVAPAIEPNFNKESKERPYHSNFSWNYDFEQIKKLTSGRIALLSDTKEIHRSEYIKYLGTKLSAGVIEVDAVEKHFTGAQEPSILECCTPKAAVFTTRPDTIFGVTYLVLAPEHFWVKEFLDLIDNRAEVEAYIDRAKSKTDIERTDGTKEKTGVELKGLCAINPANGEKVPVWIADYVLADYATGAVMAVPSHDERDAQFAKVYNLPIIDTKLEDKEEMVQKYGKKVVKYKLRDWVFSRQRYWGEPIPLIHCPECGVVAVPEKDLPVKLPKVKFYEPTGTGESPLAAIDSWVNVKCPQCKGKAKRETNTMPQWAGSSWYYLRFMDPDNKKAFVDPAKEKYWSPVDLYVGGAEHATRHLIYARFWHKFLYDIGAVSGIEPFKKLQSVGLIMAEDGRKMSKRFGNVVNPDDIVKQFGADTLRIYEMFMGPFDQAIAWSTQSMVGSRRFIERVWKLAERVGAGKSSAENDRILHKAIKKVTDDIQSLRFNTAISTLMIALNELEKSESLDRHTLETYLKLLAPFAPHVTEELWTDIGNKKSVHVSEWPIFDPALLVEATATIILQINGKTRGSFIAPSGAGKEELEKAAKSAPEAEKWLKDKVIQRVIAVPGKLVNIVTA